MLCAFSWNVNSQILNQSANWPNAGWTITGSYNTDPSAFEANPTTTANFAFDDDDAGDGSHEDNIAAESPVIDLTAAFNGGETSLEVSFMYGYYYFADDALRLEYWNADTAAWVAWTQNIPGNNTTITNDFCTITKTLYASVPLNIAGFTATQLSGFKYRIYYNDNLTGADSNYGFCISSPTIISTACTSPLALVAANITSTSVDLSWTNPSGATTFEVFVTTTAELPTGTGTPVTAIPYTVTNLVPLTTYYFYVRTVCAAGVTSSWRTASFRTKATPPANDNCAAAVSLTVNPSYSCAVTASGTLLGATNSNVTDNGAGVPDDDVWFSFVATAATHRITITNVTGAPIDIVHETMSGTCGALTSVLISDADTSNPTGLVIGNTYYVRVFSYGANTNPSTAFTICIGTPPPAPANDNCAGAISLTVNPSLTCTASTAGTTLSATLSMAATPCFGNPDDDVWFSFVATSTIHNIALSNVVAVSGSSTDIYFQVLSGVCGTQTSLLCSDPNTGTVTGLTIGDTYYVRVYSYYDTARHSFTICVTTPPAPPANDLCANATPLTVASDFATGAVVGTTISAATVTGLTYTCQQNRSEDVWYTVVVPASGSITIETKQVTASPLTDTVLSVFSGTCNALTSIGCNDDDGDGAHSKLTLTDQTPGATLYVGVWKWASAVSGQFQVAAYAEALSTPVFDTNSFKAYPNPVKDILNLSYSQDISSVSIFNLLGQEVLSKNLSSSEAQIDMSNLPHGTYLVKVMIGNEVKTIKVLKE